MTVLTLPYKREISNYKTERIPKSEPLDKSEQNPGLLCWGDTGTIPTPVPVSLGFEVVPDEKHTEIERETEPVRIENPDDPSQYVMVDRTKKMRFGVERHEVVAKNINVSTGGEDFSDFPEDTTKRSSFETSGTTETKKQLQVIFKSDDGTI